MSCAVSRAPRVATEFQARSFTVRGPRAVWRLQSRSEGAPSQCTRLNTRPRLPIPSVRAARCFCARCRSGRRFPRACRRAMAAVVDLVHAVPARHAGNLQIIPQPCACRRCRWKHIVQRIPRSVRSPCCRRGRNVGCGRVRSRPRPRVRLRGTQVSFPPARRVWCAGRMPACGRRWCRRCRWPAAPPSGRGHAMQRERSSEGTGTGRMRVPARRTESASLRREPGSAGFPRHTIRPPARVQHAGCGPLRPSAPARCGLPASRGSSGRSPG